MKERERWPYHEFIDRQDLKREISLSSLLWQLPGGSLGVLLNSKGESNFSFSANRPQQHKPMVLISCFCDVFTSKEALVEKLMLPC